MYNSWKKEILMKTLLILTFILSFSNASILDIKTFEADFNQTITDEKNNILKYNGHVIASHSNNAKWNYTSPILKDVYITKYEAVIVEPEIEQVIIRTISSDFDFFSLVKSAKKISKNTYIAKFNTKEYKIEEKDGKIKSISFLDHYENKVKILFSNQKQNHKIDSKRFTPNYPMDFDIIRD